MVETENNRREYLLNKAFANTIRVDGAIATHVFAFTSVRLVGWRLRVGQLDPAGGGRRQIKHLPSNADSSNQDFKALRAKYRILVPEFVKDYVSLNKFAV